MARALLTILLALPLLAPPGVCLCGADTRRSSPAKSQKAKPAKKTCSCCGRCHSAPEAAPAPERHEPDCPAALCASVVEKWDVSPRAAVEIDSTCFSLTTSEANVASALRPANNVPLFASPPPYLAHQSFLL